MGDFIAQADVEDRLSETKVRRFLDDDNDGDPDTSVLNRLIEDAESKVKSYLGPVHTVSAVVAAAPKEVKRLTLDVFTALAAQRHPEFARADWESLMKAAERDLKMLRDGYTNLGVDGAPEPAANQGAFFSSGDINDPDPRPRFFTNFGDF